MSYVTPPTFVDNTTALAPDVNILSADIADLNARVVGNTFQGVYLAKTGGLACTNGVWTDVTWATGSPNVGGWWTSGATLTIPSGALVSGFSNVLIRIDLTVRWATNNAGQRQFKVLQNGSLIGYIQGTSAINGDNTVVTGFVPAVCAATDTLKVQILQNSGGTLSANYVIGFFTRLGGV